MAVLRRKFSESAMCRIVARKNFKRRRGIASVEDLKNLPQQEIDNIHFLMGHMSFGIHKAFSAPCDYVTLLRNPVSRVISQYYYLTMNPTHEDHKFVKDMSLEEYAASNMSSVNNFQVRLLSAEHEFSSVESFELPANALEVAKKNLKEHFRVVGVVERFAETLFVVKHFFNFGNVYYGRRHDHPDSPQRLPDHKIPLATRHLIEHNNQLDLALYSYANELLDESIKKYGNSFDKDFARFNRINGFLQYAHAIEWMEDAGNIIKKTRKLAKRFTNKFFISVI